MRSKEIKKMEWRSININKNNIKAETGKAVLIACPHNSDYDGWSFWHPSKLVREGRHSGAVSISYNTEWNFILKKYKGKELVDEDEINYESLEEAFGVVNDNINAKTDKNIYETHKPGKVTAVYTKVDTSLIDDEAPF